MKKKLARSYYLHDNVVEVARDILGKYLCCNIKGIYCSGVITEAEAYNGVYDKACHAFGGRRTARTETMYSKGGTAYIYLCYGIHSLFNVVTNKQDIPDAVLIRAVFPVDGVKTVLKRRSGRLHQDGPGKVSTAFAFNTNMDGEDLLGKKIWLEDRGISFPDRKIKVGPRIGCESAGADGQLPYRFLYTDIKSLRKELE